MMKAAFIPQMFDLHRVLPITVIQGF